jgi:Cu/Ag efflux protein CusF
MHIRLRPLLSTLALATVVATAPVMVNAQPATGAAAATDPATELAEGEIRRIDRDQRKMTLRHGELRSLDMPPMTMVFQLADPTWAEQFKVGDKIRFAAEKINGAYTVVKIEKAP